MIITMRFHMICLMGTPDHQCHLNNLSKGHVNKLRVDLRTVVVSGKSLRSITPITETAKLSSRSLYIQRLNLWISVSFC